MYGKKDPTVCSWREVDDELTASEQQRKFRQCNRNEDSDATETESLYKLPSKGKGKERAAFLLGRDKRRVAEIAGSVSACSRSVAPDQRYRQRQLTASKS